MKTYRRLFAMTRPYRGGFLLSFLCLAGYGLFNALMYLMLHPLLNDVLKFQKQEPTLLKYFRQLHIDRLVVADPRHVSWWVLGLLFIIVLLKGASQYLSALLINRVGLRVVKDLRDTLFERTLQQGFRFYARHPSGNLISRVISDCDKLQSAVAEKLAEIMLSLFAVAGLLASLFGQNVNFAAAVLLVGPVIAIPLSRLSRRLRRVARRGQEQTAEMADLLKETITGARVVKAFNMEGTEAHRFRQITLKVFLQNHKVASAVALNSPLMDLVGSALIGAIFLFAVRWTAAYQQDPAKLLTFLVTLFVIFTPLKKLAQANTIMQVALASAERCFEILDEPLEIAEVPGAPAQERMRDRIEFHGVRFGYRPGKPVLDGITLSVRRGETVAIVGGSGAGKTTLVNLLPRFFDPDAGAVLFDGTDIRGVSLASLRAQVGVVSQEVILFNDSIAENIRYGSPGATAAMIEAAAKAAYAHDFVRRLPKGYDTVIGEAGSQLSGGQRQRIAIARAVLKDPPILILDEATSALDAESEAWVQRALQNLMAGRTALIIAHRLSTVRHADRVIVMDGGKIVETGTHGELLARDGVYRRLTELQYFAPEA